MSEMSVVLQGKRPTRYAADGTDVYYWTWFRTYEGHPPGFRPHLLPAEVFDAMREAEGLDANDADGNPPYAVGFDTEGEAMEAARRAAEIVEARGPAGAEGCEGKP